MLSTPDMTYDFTFSYDDDASTTFSHSGKVIEVDGTAVRVGWDHGGTSVANAANPKFFQADERER